MILAILTEVRKDGMQKWERYDLPKSDHMRYIWISAYQSKIGVKVGTQALMKFIKGTGGSIGGHWAGWEVMEIIDPAKMEM